MMRLTALFLSVMALAACASTPPATQAEKDAAALAYVSCLHKAAARMDDGTSDAASVAVGLRSLCAAQFGQYRDVYARSMTLRERRMFEERVSAQQIDFATTAVLDVRAQRRGAHQ